MSESAGVEKAKNCERRGRSRQPVLCKRKMGREKEAERCEKKKPSKREREIRRERV
jgi:hypothetical protein